MEPVDGVALGFGSAMRRAGVHAAAMIPLSIAVFVLIAWWLPEGQAGVAFAFVVGMLLTTSSFVALLPQSERVVRRVAHWTGQTVAGIFAAMYIISVGLAYFVGGIVHGDGGEGAIIAGAVIVCVGVLPLYLGRAAPVDGSAIWLPYAVVLTAFTALLLAAFGVGLAILAPTVAAWLAVRDRRRARVVHI